MTLTSGVGRRVHEHRVVKVGGSFIVACGCGWLQLTRYDDWVRASAAGRLHDRTGR